MSAVYRATHHTILNYIFNREIINKKTSWRFCDDKLVLKAFHHILRSGHREL